MKVKPIPMGTLPRRPPTTWWWLPLIPMAHLVLVEGEEGVGKGMFATWVAVQVTSGAWGSARPVLWLSSEEEPEDVQNRLLAAGHEPGIHERVFFLRVIEDDGEECEDTIRLPRDFKDLKALVLDTGAGVIVTDVLRDHVNAPERLGMRQLSNNDETWIRPAAGSWERLAAQTGVTVLGLHHRNKGMGTARQKSTGSIAWRQRARAVVVLARGANDERALALDKSNVGPEDKTVYGFRLREDVDYETAVFELGAVEEWAKNIDHWEKIRSEPVKFEMDPVVDLTQWCQTAALNGCLRDDAGDVRLPTWDELRSDIDISRRRMDEAIATLLEQGVVVEKTVKRAKGYTKYFWKSNDHQ